MHIGSDSLVVVNEGEPWAGQVGRVSKIRIFYEQGQPPRTLISVYLLISGFDIPFEPHQISLRSNNDHEIMAHMLMEQEPERLAA